MDRTLLLKAVNKVKGLAESGAVLSAEEAGVLELYLSTRPASETAQGPEEHDLCARIREVLALWEQSSGAGPGVDGLQESGQRVLGEALGKLQRADDHAVSPAELELVRATQAALSRREGGGANKLKLLIDRLLVQYEARQPSRTEPTVSKAQAAAPAAPGEVANHIHAESFFEERAKRRVDSLHGIEADLSARVYELDGETVLDGDVPDDALLVVRNGGITINGFMGGSVVAAQDITINGNVSGGWVVSAEGDIDTGRALSGSSLIAKQGSVRAKRMEAPSCVFAFGDLRVRGDVSGGKLLGRNIQIEGAVSGAELHAVGRIEAERFETCARSHTLICLRETLCCEDYGQPLDPGHRKLHRSIGKHQYDARALSQIIGYAWRDVYDAQRTILFYLLGGAATTQGVRALRGLQCQATYFTGLAETAKKLARLLRSQMQARRGIPADDIKVVAHECIDALRHIEDETETTANAFDLRHKGVIIRAAREQCARALALAKGEMDAPTMAEVLPELETKACQWKAQAEELLAKLAEQVQDFGLDPKVVRNIEEQTDRLGGMLDQVFAEVDKRPDSERYRRARSSVVRLIQATISRNLDNIGQWERRLQETRTVLDKVRGALDASGAYVLPSKEGGRTEARARTFEAGVIIVMNPASRADPVNTAEERLELGSALAEPTTFTLYRGALHQQAWEDAPQYVEI